MSCIAVLLCTSLSAAVLTLAFRNDDGKDGTEGDRSDTNALPPIYPIIIRAVTTGKLSSPHSTPPSTSTTQSTARPVPLIPKVCTVTDSVVEPIMVPADGLCSFLFYHPLRLIRPRNTFGTQDHSHLHNFFEQARNSFRTRFGMSVNFRDVSRFASAFRTTRGKQDYESFFDYNIFDWGVLFIDEFQVAAGSRRISEALTILQHNLHSYWRHRHGHLTYPDTSRPVCNVMPPTSFRNPRLQGAKYGHSLRDALHLVRCFWQHGVRTYFSVSTTMQGRWTNPTMFVNRTGGLRVGFYDECQSGSYSEDAALKVICDDASGPYARNLAYDSNIKAVITFDENRNFSLTFDNEKSLNEKICDAWESVTDLQVAVAVYDVSYDHRNTRCDARWLTGAWSRLRSLLRLSAFIERYYKRPEDKNNCYLVT